MSMHLFVNGNDFGECLACDFDFAERRVRMVTMDETMGESVARHLLHKTDLLAREIADAAALSLVNSCSVSVDHTEPGWREIGEEYFEDLEDQLEYLHLRGKAERDLMMPRWVRLSGVEA